MSATPDQSARKPLPRPDDAGVRAELTRLLFRQAIPSYIAAILLAATLAVLLWHVPDSQRLKEWASLIVAIYALRSVLVVLYYKWSSDAPAEAKKWARAYGVGALLGGLAWGSLSWGLWQPGWDAADQTLIVFSLAGMAAGSATAYASRLSSYLAFMLPCLLPLALRATVAPHTSIGLGLIVLLYMAGLTALARNQNRALRQNILVGHENRALSRDLGEHVARLEQEARAHESVRGELRLLNETLEQRVAERTQALRREAQRSMRTANALKLANRRNRLILDTAGEGILGLDAQGRVAFVNPAATRMLGRTEAGVIGRPYAEVLFDGHQTLGSLVIEKTLREGSRHREDRIEFIRRDASTFPVEYLSSPIQDMHQILGAVITFVDATERRRSEAALQTSERRFSAIVNSAQDAIAMLDEHHQVVLWNQAAALTFQYTSREASGRPIYDLVTPQPLRSLHERMFRRLSRRTRRSGGRRTLEIRLRRRSGEELPVELSIADVGLDGHRHFILVARDISERKRVEQALAAERALYQTLVDNLPLRIYYKDTNGVYLSANRRFLEDLEVNIPDLEGKTDFDLFPVDLAEKHRRNDREAQDSGRIQDREISFRQNGEERFIHTLVTPLINTAGKPSGILGIISDITEQKREERERQALEMQLRHAQKLEAVGQLAAGIAHEINTPIQFVSDNTRFLEEAFRDINPLLSLEQRLAGEDPVENPIGELHKLSAGIDLEFLEEEIPRAIEQSLQGLERIAHIVRAMKEFSHPGANNRVPTDINRAIETTAEVSRNEWKYHAELRLDLDPSLPQPPTLPVEINQVLLNILVNAAHAVADRFGDSGKKGHINISTRRVDDEIAITVSDDGCGMPETVRQHIFEPFFTTKEVGRGTGQGLAIAYSVVVDKHGGRIEVSSDPGKGTTFTIRLPLSPPTRETVPA